MKMPVCTANARPANVTLSIALYAVDNATRMENRRIGNAQRTLYGAIDIQSTTSLNYGCIQCATDFNCGSLFDQKIAMHDAIHCKFCWSHYNYRASQNSLNICVAVFSRNDKIVRLHAKDYVIMINFHHLAHLPSRFKYTAEGN